MYLEKENQNIKADEKNKVKVDDEEVERKFIAFLKKNCGEFQQARSFDKIRVALYQTFDKYLGIENTDKSYIQKVVLSNLGFFQSMIQDSIKNQDYAYSRHGIVVLSDDLKKRYIELLSSVFNRKRLYLAKSGIRRSDGYQRMEEITIMKMKCTELKNSI